MGTNRYGHIDLRVTSLARTMPLYRELLPELGFSRLAEYEVWTVFSGEGPFPDRPFFSLVEKADHQPNGNRIAFWVDSRVEVDRLAEIVRNAGVPIHSGPRLCDEYTPTYYAIFFEDLSGNHLEIYHRMD